MSSTQLFLVIGDDEKSPDSLRELGQQVSLRHFHNFEAAFSELCRSQNPLSGIYLSETNTQNVGQYLSRLQIWERFPDGVSLVDSDLNIVWCNQHFLSFVNPEILSTKSAAVGFSFELALALADAIESDGPPFDSIVRKQADSTVTYRFADDRVLEIKTVPMLFENTETSDQFVAVIRDVSEAASQSQKLNAIYRAGLELGDLTAEEVTEMSIDERIELMKAKILHYTEELLEFETVEIRVLDKDSRDLKPLLSVGMEAIAADRQLIAEPVENGVTGFVAATGKSYLCDDTECDPLYLPGAPGARSSLTVPLILHDKVLGTFNVESPKTQAFSHQDLQLLELFSREVAMALNTLELLAVEKVASVAESTTLILNEVAEPVDEILNDAAWILERYIGHEPSVAERLQRILKHTRDIRQHIQKVAETIVPEGSHSLIGNKPQRTNLAGKRILVVDSDDSVRRAAHELLGRCGCEVETAHNGEEACLMVRSFPYDAVIADIRLPDMTGFECFSKIRDIKADLSVILMTGFGYDPTHSIVKARQLGLNSVLYKPFRLDQLLSEVEAEVMKSDA